MKNLNIVFIAFSENSLGRRILFGMLHEGYRPNIVLMASDKALKVFRKKSALRYLRTNGIFNTIWRIIYRLTIRKDVRNYSKRTSIAVQLSIKDLCHNNDIKLEFFDDINSEETQNNLENIKPDLIVLGGAPLLKKNILNIPSIGVINAHPAVLPQAKGMDVVSQSIIDKTLLGTTVFKVDEGIDSGPILLIEYLDKDIKGLQLFEIETLIEELSSKAMLNAIALIISGNYSFTEQTKSGKIYKALTFKKFNTVKQILNNI